jgi:hypothetical protein
MGIHHHHAVISQNDRGIRVHFILGSRDGGIDTISHLCELEEIFASGFRIGREGATEIEVIDRLDRSSRHPNTGQKLSTCPVRVHEIPSSNSSCEALPTPP